MRYFSAIFALSRSELQSCRFLNVNGLISFIPGNFFGLGLLSSHFASNFSKTQTRPNPNIGNGTKQKQMTRFKCSKWNCPLSKLPFLQYNVWQPKSVIGFQYTYGSHKFLLLLQVQIITRFLLQEQECSSNSLCMSALAKL